MNTPGNDDWMPDFEDPPKENWRMSSVCRELRMELDAVKAELSAERELADKLADELEGMSGFAYFPLPALAAYKAAREQKP